ncbi:hypothetical protein ANN_03677 [Periplaneta americana]|uniref:Uncharacterized protein n=1 Tax=Periplaneta americana TaxID=6978 RepID=A0ABQ8TZH8_PERAM|nr:hypothetical protein ANN_03677 [Periplaneta americana]
MFAFSSDERAFNIESYFRTGTAVRFPTSHPDFPTSFCSSLYKELNIVALVLTTLKKMYLKLRASDKLLQILQRLETLDSRRGIAGGGVKLRAKHPIRDWQLQGRKWLHQSVLVSRFALAAPGGSDFTNPSLSLEEDELLRLWYHECCRVFQDRLVNDEDRGWFDSLLRSKIESDFGADSQRVIGDSTIIFGDFMDPSLDERPYIRITDMEQMSKVLDQYLEDYNNSTTKPMKLVLFLDAICHVSRIARVIRQPLGNALLLGMGGSGRQSLTRLATHMAEFVCFQIELTKNYGPSEWRDDIKTLMLKAGVHNRETVFLFCDTQCCQLNMNTVARTGERNIIQQVIAFCDEEKQTGQYLFPINQATKRAAAITCRSERLIKKIRREGVCAGDEKLESPGKNRPREPLILVDDMDRCILRRKIQEFYTMQKEVPTLEKLLKVAREAINFQGGRETLRKQAVTSSEEETRVTRTGIQQAQQYKTSVQANGNSGHQMEAIPKRVEELRSKLRLTRSRIMQVGDSSGSNDEGRGENKISWIWKTSFDGEIIAISESLRNLLCHINKFKNAVILSDSKAAILSIISKHTPSSHTAEITKMLSQLIPLNKRIVFQWIPSHCGILGNENADFSKEEQHCYLQTCY